MREPLIEDRPGESEMEYCYPASVVEARVKAMTELTAERDRYKAALEKLAKCNGGCDGPLACMCSAPIAREALGWDGSC